MPDRHFRIASTGASKVFSGTVNDGLEPGTWRIRCLNGISITVPKALFPMLKHLDNPSIVLSMIAHELQETEAPVETRQ